MYWFFMIAIFFGAKEQVDSGSNFTFYRQDNNFLYLTGLKIPEAILIIFKMEEKEDSILFIEKTTPHSEMWTGKKMTSEEAKEISGIEKIQFTENFLNTLSRLLYHNNILYISYNYIPLNNIIDDKLIFIDKLRKHFPYLQIRRIGKILATIREIKSKEEVELLRKAIAITDKGIRAVMQAAKAGMYEYELQALMEYEFKRLGSPYPSFNSIVASGINATVLHYDKNSSKITNDDMILFDVGATYCGYSADISRTFPVSGKFNDMQRLIYQGVLDVQEAIIKMIKPGIEYKELQIKATELLSAFMMKNDCIEKAEEISKYYFHPVSHFLGLDTHDSKISKVLKPGHIITVEPGLYIDYRSIGIRIEDDILVTEDGYENLSSDIPKTIEEIEALMK